MLTRLCSVSKGVRPALIAVALVALPLPGCTNAW
jgi:hypothetical protein